MSFHSVLAGRDRVKSHYLAGVHARPPTEDNNREPCRHAIRHACASRVDRNGPCKSRWLGYFVDREVSVSSLFSEGAVAAWRLSCCDEGLLDGVLERSLRKEITLNFEAVPQPRVEI